jgi:hypothetical protein
VITIVALELAVFEFPSVALTLTVKVPAVLKVVAKLDPVPVAGVPPVAVHAKVKGPVPPDALAVKDTLGPTVPVEGPVMDTARASGEMVTVADPLAVIVFASVTVTPIV